MKEHPWELTNKEAHSAYVRWAGMKPNDYTWEQALCRAAQLKLVKWLEEECQTVLDYERRLSEVKASLAPDAREGER